MKSLVLILFGVCALMFQVMAYTVTFFLRRNSLSRYLSCISNSAMFYSD